VQAEERAARDAAAAARTDAAAAGSLKEKGAKLEAELQVRFEECVDVNDCLLALSLLLPLVVVAAVVVIMLFVSIAIVHTFHCAFRRRGCS
jgi:hypothetical protein